MIKAIETHYAGHHFRSRLEARWAVFFDHMGISWQYEIEGFDLSARLSNGPTRYRYLPDFWLPEHQLWVEVKGEFSDAELLKTLDCLAALSCNEGGGRHDSGGYDSVVLGPIPRVGPIARDGITSAPAGLCMNKGLLTAVPWTGQSGCLTYTGNDMVVAYDCGGDLIDVCYHSVDHTRSILTYGLPSLDLPAGWNAALEAARTARFEHGAKPETVKPYSNARVPTECQNDRCVSGRLYDLPSQWSFRFCPDPAHHRAGVT